MNLSARDRKALIFLGAALVVFALLKFVVFPDSAGPADQTSSLDSAQLRQRVALLRQTAALLPVREALQKQSNADLADREKGIIQAGTAAEAQSELLQTAQRIGKANEIDVRGGELSPPKAFGEYGIVYATVTFDCHIEQLLNFLADLTREPQMIVPSEEHITSGNVKDKTMTVRLVLAGVVAKKLIPEKKGFGTF
jgi:hypothetical protein